MAVECEGDDGEEELNCADSEDDDVKHVCQVRMLDTLTEEGAPGQWCFVVVVRRERVREKERERGEEEKGRRVFGVS